MSLRQSGHKARRVDGSESKALRVFRGLLALSDGKLFRDGF